MVSLPIHAQKNAEWASRTTIILDTLGWVVLACLVASCLVAVTLDPESLSPHAPTFPLPQNTKLSEGFLWPPLSLSGLPFHCQGFQLQGQLFGLFACPTKSPALIMHQ